MQGAVAIERKGGGKAKEVWPPALGQVGESAASR